MSGTYYDGWQDAITALADKLDTGPTEGCLDCTLDALRYQGIVAAAESTAFPTPATDTTLVTQVTEHLVETALDPDLFGQADLIRQTRTLVSDQPNIAIDVLTLVTLLLAKRIDPTPTDLCDIDHHDLHPTRAGDIDQQTRDQHY